MSRGRPGTRQQMDHDDLRHLAACQPTKDGLIQAFADAAAAQWRDIQIKGLRFDCDTDYRFGKRKSDAKG